MIETIEITINKSKYKYSKGITLEEVLTEHQQDMKHPVLLAKVNNRLRELSYEVKEDANVEFVDLTTHEGNRVHINGLILVLLYIHLSLILKV